MTNNEKRAEELADEILSADVIDDITPAILEALNAAEAEGYKQGAEKMREDAAILLDTKVPNIALPNGRLDRHPDGKNSPDSAQAKYSAAIRAIPITPPQAAAEVEDNEREMREAFERWWETVEPQAEFDRDGDGYHDWDVDTHWKSWKAAWKEKSK